MEKGRVLEDRSNSAIPVAWTFMSERFAMQRRIVEHLSLDNNLRSDSVSWPGDGHESPSYICSFHHGTQIVIQPQKCS